MRLTMQTLMARSGESLGRFLRDECGTTAIEYAIIASVVSIAILGSAMAVGSSLVDNFYNKAKDAFVK